MVDFRGNLSYLYVRFDAYSYCQNENVNGQLASPANAAQRQFLFESYANLTRYAGVMDALWFGAHAYNWQWPNGKHGDDVKLLRLCGVARAKRICMAVWVNTK